VAADAYAHRHLPFERMDQLLWPQRDLGGIRLLHAMFDFEILPAPTMELQGLVATPLEVDTVTATHELMLHLARGVDGLRGSFTYDVDLFDHATVTAMLQHFQTLVEGVVAKPDSPISRPPLLTEAERHELLVQWSGSQVRLPEEDVCVHELFEAHVKLSPHVAVESSRALTYELDRRANSLAHQLRIMGVGPETLVGLCVERSLEMLVGLFAILKAGGAYVPLDPAYPTDRLAFMLKDANMSVLLTQTALVDRLPRHDARLVCLDDLPKEMDRAKGESVASGVTPENLAYVIYTSGSTGTPKGAMITHRSMVKYAKVAALRFGIEPGDRILQFCSISFDISVEEIFLCLTRAAPGSADSGDARIGFRVHPGMRADGDQRVEPAHRVLARDRDKTRRRDFDTPAVVAPRDHRRRAGAAGATGAVERARESSPAAPEHLRPDRSLRLVDHVRPDRSHTADP
jgi:non-ribosomal peptide synthetase component F